jgi:hypothetical protein
MTNISLPTVLQLQPSVFHDTIFISIASTDIHGNHIQGSFLHSPEGPLVNVGADHSVTMAGIDKNILRLDLKLIFDLGTDSAKVVVADMPDLTNGNGINCDNHSACFSVIQDECPNIEAVIDRAGCRICNVNFGQNWFLR